MMKTVKARTFFQSTSSISLALVLAEHHLTHLRLLLHILPLLPLPLTVGRVLELVSVFMLCSCSASSDTNIPLLSHSVRNGKIIMRTASRAVNLYSIMFSFVKLRADWSGLRLIFSRVEGAMEYN